MKSLGHVAIVVLLVGLGLPVHAQLLAEDFAYPAGDLLTAHGWTSYKSGTTSLEVVAGSLSFTGYSSGVGNAATVTQNFDTESVQRSFAAQSSGSVYVSFLLRVESALPSTYAGSAQVVQVGPSGMGTDSLGMRFHVYGDQGKVLFGITKSGSVLPTTAADYDFDTAILIVLKYEFIPAFDSDDPLSIFVNPTLGGAEPAATLTYSSGEFDASELSEVGINGHDWDPDGDDVTRIVIDDLRVSTTWPSGPSPTIFQDGFESSNTSAWSNAVP